MNKTIIKIILFCSCINFAQTKNTVQDTSINNLVHTLGYETSEYGAIPEYIKEGNGKQTFILIPGLGFDLSVFDDFIEDNKSSYTMYAVTIPGYGRTAAPPMPVTDASYGEQNWNKGVIKGLLKLIEKGKIERPMLVGHFVQGAQLVLRMAIDYPDIVGGVIILGGPAKFIVIRDGKPQEFPLASTVKYIDNYWAPEWFRPISKKDFDGGNYLPEIYSVDSQKAVTLWKHSAAVPLPVMVRYLCEFFASDITLEVDKIKCPVLVLRSMFNREILENPINNYVQPQFIDFWDAVSSKNSLIKVIDIQSAASFVWKDRPEEVYQEIKNF